jgi:glycosyltransferase involved in cell wall biosynthesis
MQLVLSLTRILSELSLHYEVIIVDDGSNDRTWPLLRELCESHSELRAIRLTRRFGKESALAAGLVQAEGEAVIVMDGDLQHPPELIPRLVEVWRNQGVEVVEAVKVHRGPESRLNRWGARIFYALSNQLTGLDLDRSTDFKLLDRRVVDHWREMGEHNLFFRGMVPWLGFERAAVPLSVPKRDSGRSRWSMAARARLAVTALTSFSSLPLRLLSVGGVIFLILSAMLAVQTLYRWISGDALSGFTTVILLILIVSSAVMLGLGVIGEYVARIFDEVKARPRFVVAERIRPHGPDLG